MYCTGLSHRKINCVALWVAISFSVEIQSAHLVSQRTIFELGFGVINRGLLSRNGEGTALKIKNCKYLWCIWGGSQL